MNLTRKHRRRDDHGLKYGVAACRTASYSDSLPVDKPTSGKLFDSGYGVLDVYDSPIASKAFAIGRELSQSFKSRVQINIERTGTDDRIHWILHSLGRPWSSSSV